MARVKRFDQYTVEPEDLPTSEYCFKADVDFKRKTKDDSKVTDAICIITGLLNSAGGLFTFTGNVVPPLDFNIWTIGLESQLQSVLSGETYYRCIRIKTVKSPIYYVHVMAKSSRDFVTYNFHMCDRGVAGNIAVGKTGRAASIMQQAAEQSTLSDLPQIWTYGDTLKMSEGSEVEFKFSKAASVKKIVNLLKTDRTQKCLFGFPNLKTGGHLFLGIDENEKTRHYEVRGLPLSPEEEAYLTHELDDLLNGDGQQLSRIWGAEGRVPQQGREWDVHYHPVEGCPKNERRVVVQIVIQSCPGGMFRQTPEAFWIDQDGAVMEYSFQEWKDHVIPANVSETKSQRKYFPSAHEAPPATTEPTSSPSISPVMSPSSPGDKARSIFTKIKEHFKKPEYQTQPTVLSLVSNLSRISWSQNNPGWKSNLQYEDKSLEKTLSSLRDIFRISKQLHFIPGVETILSAYPEYRKEINECINHIKTTHGDTEGVVIASNEWLKLITQSDLQKPTDHLIDLLSLDCKCRFILTSVMKENKTHTSLNNQLAYNRLSSRLLRDHIVRQSRFISLDCESICIQGRLWIAGEGTSDSTCNEIQCSEYFSNGSQWEPIQMLLGLLLFARDSNLMARVVNEGQIHMSSEQMEILLSSHRPCVPQFNLIEGPPGSGKTLMGLTVCLRLDPESCLTMCTNPCLKNFLDYQKASHTALVKDHNDLEKVISGEMFQSLYCVIVDDAQNMNLDNKTWKYFFGEIYHHKIHMFVFMDNHIQNFQNTSGDYILNSFEEFRSKTKSPITYQIKTLTEVHRNTQKVLTFMTAGFDESTAKLISCAHEAEGDDVEILNCTDLFLETTENELFIYIQSLVDPERVLVDDKSSYESKDIAVLFDGDRAGDGITLFTELFEQLTPKPIIQNAGKFPVIGIIVDHLDSFSGLDAKVVIMVDTGNADESMESRHLMNPKYKAFVASRGIFRVVFVKESSDTNDLVASMNLDARAVAKQIRSNQPSYAQAAMTHTYEGSGCDIYPMGIAVCSTTGYIFVTDSRNDCVHVLSSKLQFLYKFGEKGSTEGQYNQPIGIEINNNGHLYISDSDNNRIQVTDHRGIIQFIVTQPWRGTINPWNPGQLAIDTEDKIYVCDRFSTRIQVLDVDGEFLREIHLPYSMVHWPEYIAINQGLLAISDSEGDVYLLQKEWQLTSVQSEGNAPNIIQNDKSETGISADGLIFDLHGHILVTNKDGCIYVLREHDLKFTGNVIILNKSVPRGITLTHEGHILVRDNSRVNLVTVPRNPPGHSN